MIEKLIVEGVDIILASAYSSQLFAYRDLTDSIGLDITLSDNVDYFESNTIAAKETLGSVPIFAYFKCFTIPVWISILFSMLSLALISKLMTNNQKFKSFGTYVWNYSIILMAGSMAKPFLKAAPHLILSLWLVSALILSNLFNAFIMDFMVTTVPIIRIKTLEELSERKDMKIVVRVDHFLTTYTQGQSKLARDLARQLEPYDDFYEEKIDEKLIKGLTQGTVAYITDGLLMIFTLIGLSQTHDMSFKSIFISRGSSSEMEPYFLIINKGMPSWAIETLNNKLDKL